MGGRVGRVPSRGDRFDNVRGEEGRQQADDVSIADLFERREFGDATDLPGDQRPETAMGSPDLLQQDRIGGCRTGGPSLDDEPHLHPAALDPKRHVSDQHRHLCVYRLGGRGKEDGRGEDHAQVDWAELDAIDDRREGFLPRSIAPRERLANDPPSPALLAPSQVPGRPSPTAIAPGSPSMVAASVAIRCSSSVAGRRHAPGICSAASVTSGRDT